MEGLTAAGLGSGLDIKALVDQLVAAERQPANDRLNLAEARTNRELSSIGKLKSALAKFGDVLDKMSDLAKFQQRKTSVAEADLLAATATSDASPGIYAIEIRQLATRHKLASQVFADASTPVGYGTLSITLDGQTAAISIAEEANTLADIRDAINDALDNPGVAATIINADDGARLVLTSRDTGTASTFSIVSSDGDGGLAVFDYAPAAPGLMTEIEVAADAEIAIDGFTVTSSSNSISGALEGVSLDLLAADIGNVFELNVDLDQEASKAILEQFVSAYNAVATTIKTETQYDGEAGVAGALLGDSTVRGIQNALRRELSGVVDDVSSTFGTLAEIGILTTADGTLEIDAEKLNAAFAADFDAIGKLFTAEDGIGVQLDDLVNSILDDNGQIEGREDRLRNRLDDLGDDRERLDLRMESVRRRLEIQFNAMDQFIAQLSSTSQFLAQQLG